MKRSQILFVMALICYSCTSPTPSISPALIQMYVGDTATVESFNTGRIYSQDAFYASVDNNNVVRGNHVGTVEISADVDQTKGLIGTTVTYAVSSKVMVLPRISFYPDVEIDWNVTSKEICDKMSLSYDSTATDITIQYGDSAIVCFSMTEKHMTSIHIGILYPHSDEDWKQFLQERYAYENGVYLNKSPFSNLAYKMNLDSMDYFTLGYTYPVLNFQKR